MTNAGQRAKIRPYVIAISGTSGGGKTTLVNKTAELLSNSARLYFDDYLSVDNDPMDIRGWLDGGANPDEFRTPQLAADLRRLTSGEAIRVADERGVVEPAEYIIVEDPFGRARSEVAPLIDFAAHLDLPPEIALARRIVRALETRGHPDPEKLLQHLIHDLKTYLVAGREAYVAAECAARKTADLILDGTKTVDDLAGVVVMEVNRKRYGGNGMGR